MTVEVSEAIEIIYIEDNSDIADVTATFLERNDDRFTVETFPRAGVALDWLEQSLPDCILSDYDMPGMDGVEFLKQVREEYSKLPFFLYTGKGNESVASSAISAGVTDYLQKETGLQQYELLANRISNAVTKYRAEQTAANRLHELQQTNKNSAGSSHSD
ncbi:MAG: response regulator containing CheY-like receiver, AAA-type ATPase, and DNA-binding domain protein [halophilic archaeon J07HX5]|jgi:Response regulator containing CheY-like receiver, AAA-type ATPase, and DNA-binding domains|nr:MAG: response regulator containing CheY-like receiver, AAA-type ATPase, and DNA-binding domain protein [halophilic archaeon J07HX5]